MEQNLTLGEKQYGRLSPENQNEAVLFAQDGPGWERSGPEHQGEAIHTFIF